jgi:hypothetical protein
MAPYDEIKVWNYEIMYFIKLDKSLFSLYYFSRYHQATSSFGASMLPLLSHV